jgi:hypothetical protein
MAARRILLSIVGLALAIVALAPATASARRPVRALAFAHAASPVLDELRTQLGSPLRIVRATRERLRHRRRYRLLIVDGDTLSPATLARHRSQIDRYLDGGGRVLALDVGLAHFARALDRLTRFSFRPHGAGRSAGRSSRAFLFHQTVVGGVPTVPMLDAPSLEPMGAEGLAPDDRRQAAADQAARVAGLIRARLEPGADRAARLDVGTPTGADSPPPQPGADLPAQPDVTTSTGDDGPPPEALHVSWPYTYASAAVSPQPAYYQQNTPDPGITPPTPGQQTVSYTVTHQFDVYLDNSPSHPDGNHQVVAYNLLLQTAPKYPNEKFTFMDDQFSVGPLTRNLERAWWTGLVDVDVNPDAATNGKLTWQNNAPATPNEETEYTAGQTFEVGVSVTDEGPAVEGGYTVSNETKYEVPDWGVVSDTAGNHLSWEFSARNNCDVRPNGAGNCFATFDKTPVRPNDLSLGNLSVNASGLWNTNTLLQPGNGNVSFTLNTPITLADTVCAFWFVTACRSDDPDGRFIRPATTGPAATTASFDVADVVPVGIKSLTLAPNPADGGTNQAVTGTVTLTRPAPIQTTIKLFSDYGNATLPIPLGDGVSTDTLTFKPGDQTKTFQILTNANDLPKGQHVSADITAFYAEPTTADPPLRIVNK